MVTQVFFAAFLSLGSPLKSTASWYTNQSSIEYNDKMPSLVEYPHD